MSRRALAIAPIAIVTILACKKPPQVSFDLEVPADVSPNVTWFEIGVFEKTSCATVAPTLAGGIPPEGTVRRLAFRSDDPRPPALGNLPKAKYAFAAVARAEDCSVLASGCSDVDVTEATSIRIAMQAAETPVGACATGAVCTDARCVPSIDNSDPTIGARCSLDLLGAGPLANPLVPSGGVASAPALVTTPNGFLLAYREFDPFDGAARLTTIPIDNGGGSLAPQTTLLTACASSEESDGAAIAWGPDAPSGFVVLSRAPCNGVGGVDVFEVDPAGAVVKSGFSGRNGARATLSFAHGAAIQPGGKSFLLAFTEQAAAHVVTGDGVALSNSAPTFGGNAMQSDAWVATSEKVIALLAGGTTGAPPILDAGDAGNPSPDGGDAGAGAPPDAGTSAGGNTMHLNVVAAGARLDTLVAPMEFAGTWGSIAAQGSRVIVATDGTTPGRPVVWRAFDLGKTQPTTVDGFTTDGDGKVIYADVAFRRDYMIFAVERAGSISLVVYDHGTTTPAFARQLRVDGDPRVPSMSTLRDGRLAIAMSDNRVALAWITGKTLTQDDPVGGYAVFACTGP
jgi:hypothetical protein